jgi:hypothetical protein
MADEFTAFEVRLICLEEKLDKNDPRYVDVLVLESQLRLTIDQMRLYGEEPSRRADLNRIVRQLNQLALDVTGRSFNDICSDPHPDAPPGYSPVGTDQQPTTLIADYEDVRRALETLLQPDCHKRILLIEGKSGTGKTMLLTHLLEELLPRSIPRIVIQLRDSAVTIDEVFYRSGILFGWERLPNFTSQVANLVGTRTTQIDRNLLVGVDNRISVALHAKGRSAREYRRTTLTEAWFNDLRLFDQMILVVLDSFEQANTEVASWISGPLLARAAGISRLRVVLAGQCIPDSKNIEWGHCCTTHLLTGVGQAKHWMPVVQSMKCQIPLDYHAMDWLAGVCDALKGRPADIMQIIESLPLTQSLS